MAIFLLVFPVFSNTCFILSFRSFSNSSMYSQLQAKSITKGDSNLDISSSFEISSSIEISL